jgi:hypothetical protein
MMECLLLTHIRHSAVDRIAHLMLASGAAGTEQSNCLAPLGHWRPFLLRSMYAEDDSRS